MEQEEIIQCFLGHVHCHPAFFDRICRSCRFIFCCYIFFCHILWCTHSITSCIFLCFLEKSFYTLTYKRTEMLFVLRFRLVCFYSIISPAFRTVDTFLSLLHPFIKCCCNEWAKEQCNDRCRRTLCCCHTYHAFH